MASSGNFCVWNAVMAASNFTGTLSIGNTKSQPTSDCTGFGTMAMTTGKKWYFEARAGAMSGGSSMIGIMKLSDTHSISNYNTYQHSNTNLADAYYVASGDRILNGSGSTVGGAYSEDDVIGVAVDLESSTNTITFYKNNSGQGSLNLTGTGIDYVPSLIRVPNAGGFIGNWGQDSTFGGAVTAGGNSDANGFGDFLYSVPSGHLAICSANLGILDDIDPAQTDDDNPSKLFNIVTYTGNGGTQSITGLGFKPDLAVIKAIPTDASSTSWNWFDSSRGVHKSLESDNSNAEENNSNKLTAFGTDGFSVGSDADVNANSVAYCCWGWRLNGGTTASNTSGDINSTTQASDKTGLSVVLYTGNGSQGQSIGHGLTKAPEMVWFKNRSSASVSGLAMEWIVALSTSTGSPFASRSGSAQTLELNTADAMGAFYRTEGNFTPTTSTFSVPNNGNAPYWFNANGDNYLAYCWHSVEGFSKFGFYEGNGNADGPFIYTGFRPRLLMVKNIDASGGWIVVDTKRETFNPVGELIVEWNDSYGQFDPAYVNMDILSNGFKLRNTDQKINSSHTFMYMAWGDVPFKYNNTF
jgi:hypothetical protein